MDTNSDIFVLLTAIGGWLVAIIITIVNVWASFRNTSKIEKLKGDISKEIVRLEIKERHLHEKRIDAIAELFQRLDKAEGAFRQRISYFKFIPQGKTKEDVEYENMVIARDAGNDLLDYKSYARLFLTKRAVQLLDQIENTLKEIWVDYNMKVDTPPSDSDISLGFWREANDKLNNIFVQLKKEIETEFRDILGTDITS